MSSAKVGMTQLSPKPALRCCWSYLGVHSSWIWGNMTVRSRLLRMCVEQGQALNMRYTWIVWLVSILLFLVNKEYLIFVIILILIIEVIVRYQIEAPCPKDRLCRLWQIVDEMLLNSWRSRRSVIGGSSGRPIDSRKAREYTIISWAWSLGSRRVYIVCIFVVMYIHYLLKYEIQ